jgi:hypothetical protein
VLDTENALKSHAFQSFSADSSKQINMYGVAGPTNQTEELMSVNSPAKYGSDMPISRYMSMDSCSRPVTREGTQAITSSGITSQLSKEARRLLKFYPELVS